MNLNKGRLSDHIFRQSQWYVVPWEWRSQRPLFLVTISIVSTMSNRFTKSKDSIKTGESKLWIYESIGRSLSCIDTLVLLRQHLIRKSPLYDFFYLLRPSSQTNPTWFFEMQKSEQVWDVHFETMPNCPFMHHRQYFLIVSFLAGGSCFPMPDRNG